MDWPQPRTGLFKVMVGAAWVGACFAAGLARGWSSQRVPVTVLTAVLLLLAAPALIALGRRLHIDRPASRLLLGYAFSSPLLVLGAIYAAGQPLVVSHWRCGTGEASLFLLVPFGLFFFGALGPTLAGVFLSLGGERPVRWLAAATGVASLVLLGQGLLKARSAVDVDLLVQQLPVLGVLPPVTGAPAFELPGSRPGGVALQVHVDHLGRHRFERRCERDDCTLHMTALDLRGPAAPPERHFGSWFRAERSALLTVRSTSDQRVMVVEKGGQQIAFVDGQLSTLGVRDVTRHVAPPLGWLLGGLLAVVSAALLGLRRLWLTALLAALARTARTHLPESAGPTQLAEQLHQRVVDRRRQQVLTLDAAILAVCALLSAPLFAAWMAGLL
jgi:hypothetical protein